MAKALFGHVGAAHDLRLAAEVRRLRSRVQHLENELAVAHATNEALGSSLTVEDDIRTLTLDRSEPALT